MNKKKGKKEKLIANLEERVAQLEASEISHKETERRLATHYAVTRILAESDSLGNATPKILQIICESLGFQFGTLWGVERQEEVLRCIETWHIKETDATEFEPDIQERVLREGVGLPERIWKSGEPVWISDITRDPEFPISHIAIKDGLHSAFGFPILLGNEILGVMEFFGFEIKEPYEALLQMVSSIGSQIGQFIERKRAEEALQKSSEATKKRLEALVEMSNLLASTLDYETTINCIANLMVRFIADQCIVYIYEDGKIQAFASAHSDSSKDRLLQEVKERYKPDFNSSSFVVKVFRTGKTEIVPEVTDFLIELATEDNDLIDKLKSLKSKSSMVVPLITRGRVIGALALTSERASNFFGPVERAFAEDLARRASLAVDNASLYREAQQANRLKDDFLATVSHELRTPLTAILGWTRLLRSGKLDSKSVGRALETVERNAKTQAQLIEDLLDISRIITGKLQLHVEPVDLVPIIDVAVNAIRPAADAKNIDLRVFVENESMPTSGDPTRLQQIIWNLLSNAVKFTPDAGNVEIKLEMLDNFAEITVIDTGKGINPDFLPFVFDQFRQADSTITRNYGGLGLGLAIVRNLVELHNGKVEASSEGDGKGARFKVSLPLVPLLTRSLYSPPEESSPIKSSIILDSSNNLARFRVLVVDDEIDTRELIATTITQYNGEVRTAGTVDEALNLLDEWMPSVLISDISMPGKDGYQLIHKIRSRPSDDGGQLPAIALTAYTRSEDKLRAITEGFNVHISKPIEPTELIKAIIVLAGLVRVGD